MIDVTTTEMVPTKLLDCLLLPKVCTCAMNTEPQTASFLLSASALSHVQYRVKGNRPDAPLDGKESY